MAKIVVHTNFSVNATHAARRAALVGSAMGDARVELLHVIPASPVTRWMGPSEDEIARFERADAQMAAMLRLLRSTTAAPVEGRIVHGPLVHSIGRASEKSDLLVVLAAARPPLLPVLDATHRLISKAIAPVLVVRKPATFAYRRVVIAMDVVNAPAKAIRMARAVAPNARVDVVHVYRGPFEGKLEYARVSANALASYRADVKGEAVMRVLDMMAASHPLPRLTFAHIVHGHATSEILGKQRQLGADLIVVSRPAKTLVQEWLMPSVSSSLLDAASSDVLVVPN